MLSSKKYSELIISNIIQETPDSKTFVFKPKNEENIQYKAGQFITLVFPKKEEEKRRSYSFSSSPLINDLPAITIKRMPNGEFSRKLIDYGRVGDVLTYSGISGFYQLPENLNEFKQLFFFAAGSGIVPNFSLIKTALNSNKEIEIILFYSNKNRENTIFLNQLITLQNEFPNRFTIEFLMSNAENILFSRLNNFLLISLLDKHKKGNWNKSYFFICGPIEYMDTINITLLTEGIPSELIRKENFNTYIPEIKEIPPDTAKRNVRISFDNVDYEFEVQYPKSILKTALEMNIPLPFSCESGQCGTCSAICTEGKVWMSYNEVLMPKELKQNIVLTCTGFPIEGNVSLKI